MDTSSLMPSPLTVAAVLPCYKAKEHVLGVLSAMPAIVNRIYCVDDACPEATGRHIEANMTDSRVRVIYHTANTGVGGAMCTGYEAALADGADIIVKIDSDGQMDPQAIPYLIAPIVGGMADYAKGNRFSNIEDVSSMPVARLVGNAGLSFLTKVSTGYWNIFDPTNGYTAVHARVLERIPLRKLSRRYFFESDLLFRLGTISARVVDIPMAAIYGDEVSNLKITSVLFPFFVKNMRNSFKRIIYNYFLRDFSVGSVYLVLGLLLLLGGGTLGTFFWVHGIIINRAATAGQVMFSALPVIFGAQLLVAFTSYDIGRTPSTALHPLLSRLRSSTLPAADSISR
ncbi:glycosyltransferase family 2 protein [Nitrospirillum sp. BR 11828]|uniref:glycosyltransferase family 2 protein n=1 Tax=Nitrospirillum sp. BR 11828 TaxID=3104325 RepID=UPI002ACA2FCE|nr:glycosyltransferase family 2 protein [Nitrospirillum sp. BR 11828]MDZ5650587.1 glycosyltransferase family 2 protein [Nitrospirillum sp. BR 11828]